MNIGKEVAEFSENVEDNLLSIDKLNLSKNLIDNLSPKQGLILIAGSFDSGRTTLLKSILDWRTKKSEKDLKFITYEEPVEYIYDDLNKLKFSKKEMGVNFDIDYENLSKSIRNTIRKRPDIISIDRIVNKEVLDEAINASMTGHLVYAVFHANFVSDVVRRMLGVFDENERNTKGLNVLSCIKVIISQILVPSTDGSRIALREYLVITPEIVEKIINSGVDNFANETEKQLRLNGHTFLQDAEEKFKQGLISDMLLKEIKIMHVSRNKLYSL